MLKVKNVKTIELRDWDDLVKKTYGKPYCFQQQDGCQSRGSFHLTVPLKNDNEEAEMNDSIPKELNDDEMGVKFEVWLARDPNQLLSNPSDQNSWSIELFWNRNFYPNIQTVANDLYSKGLIEAGDYVIDIDW